MGADREMGDVVIDALDRLTTAQARVAYRLVRRWHPLALGIRVASTPPITTGDGVTVAGEGRALREALVAQRDVVALRIALEKGASS